jgi:hypothetical protein
MREEKKLRTKELSVGVACEPLSKTCLRHKIAKKIHSVKKTFPTEERQKLQNFLYCILQKKILQQ